MTWRFDSAPAHHFKQIQLRVLARIYFMRIVFLDAATLGDVSMDPISSIGSLVCYPISTPAEARQRVTDAEVIILNKVLADRALIDAAPKLRLICVAATGVNNVDLDYAASKGITVRNAVGYSTESVVQTTFMIMLSLLGKCARLDSFVKSGDYSRSGIFTNVDDTYPELAGKRIGIIGMGHIGSRVASVAEAFGMKVSYFSTSGTNHCREYPCLTLDELLSTSDIVTIHAPYNGRTAGLIGRNELSKMKPTAIILNMGRGGIIDEAALAEAIDKGTIAGAGTDVYTSEPLPADNPLMHVKRRDSLILTPHIAWASMEARARLVEMIAENILTICPTAI